MKTKLKFLLLMTAIAALILACSNNDDVEQIIETDISNIDDGSASDDESSGGEFELAEVTVILPEDSSVDLTNGTIVSLGSDSGIDSNGTGNLPLNSGTIEIGYLLDENSNVLLAGFITDERRKISVETTAEVILYYALGYYLLPDSAKRTFLEGVGQAQNFPQFIEEMKHIFVNNSLMFSEGSYEVVLQDLLEQLTSKNVSGIENRIFFNDVSTKSGVTLSSVDSTNIILQNSLPRRASVVIYKKSYKDRNGDSFEIPNYTSNTFENFELEAGQANRIEALEVGNSVQQINAQQASIDNAVKTDPILLPVDPMSEFIAEYEVVIIGSGQRNSDERNMTEGEGEIYGEINKKTYVLDHFLPTLLDIGGNKALLPGFGSDKENALYSAVML